MCVCSFYDIFSFSTQIGYVVFENLLLTRLTGISLNNMKSSLK